MTIPPFLLGDRYALTWGFFGLKGVVMEPQFLDLDNQLDLLESRGVKIFDRKRHLAKLEHISYYRIKEFAEPYSFFQGDEKRYDVSFDAIIRRYYQDKNLRINLLHAIEKIEVSLKRNVSYILGQKCGAFGYLDFSNWANREKGKFELEKKQFYFKRDLLKLLEKSSLNDLRNRKNFNSDGFPSIWLATEILMFGNLNSLVELMSKSDKNKLSTCYQCTREELLSWIKLLNFVRNVCAHNSNIIDIKLKTKPKIRNTWRKIYLDQYETASVNQPVGDRLSVIILIVITLVRAINPNYRWNSITNNISAICNADGIEKSERGAKMIGFANSNKALDFQSFANDKI